MALLRPQIRIVLGIHAEREIFLRKYATSPCRINYISTPKPLILELNVLFSD